MAPMAGRSGRDGGAVRVIRHRPERGLAMLAPLACGCCCCCCCLHAVGGIVGSVVASSSGPGKKDRPMTLGHVNGGRTYWLSLVVTLAAWIAYCVLGGVSGSGSDRLGWGLGGILLALPVMQIPAGVLALLLCAREPDREERSAARQRVGRIMLGGIAGAVAGTLLMSLVFVFIK
jgi:hypothetical protein